MPWRCVVLAVDTATQSGWSVRIAGEQSSFGEVDTLNEGAVGYIAYWALHQAHRRELPLVLVLEAPFGGPVPMLLALGAARERWLAAWRRLRLSESSTVRVQPSTWRRAVLGREWVSAPRAEVRAHEQLVAAAMVGEPVHGDEAAALLIGRWAERAPQVGKVLGGSVRRDSQPCPHCGRPRVCTEAARRENPFCAACLHDRMAAAQAAKGRTMTYSTKELAERGVSDYARTVRSFRRQHKVTQPEFAAMAGVHPDTLRSVELGRTPRPETVAKLDALLARWTRR